MSLPSRSTNNYDDQKVIAVFRKSVIIIVLMFSYLLSSSALVHANETSSEVLLIYDSLAQGTIREGNIESMQRLLAAFGIKVKISTMDSYKQGTLQTFNKVIVIRNTFDLNVNNVQYLKDYEKYTGGYLHIGAYIPENVQVALDLATSIVTYESIGLTIGQFTQPAIKAVNIPFILRTSGESYGTLTSVSGNLQGVFGARNGRLAYAAYLESGNLTELALSYLLRDWLGITAPSNMYLLIKDIYPVSDLKRLEKLADQLYESGIPFIVSVMPVFNNMEYPAIQRYMQTLRYVQSHNGSVLVNAPIVSSAAGLQLQSLHSQMNTFMDELIKNRVAPLGIGAELFWSYDQQYSDEGLQFFDSAVLLPNSNPIYRSQMDTSFSFKSSMLSLDMNDLQNYRQTGKVLKPFPVDTALTYSFFDNDEALQDAVQTLRNRWISFDDYKADSHTVITDTHQAVSNNGYLTIDGSPVDLSNITREISDKHVYIAENKKSMSTLFSVQNNIFIVLILLTLVIFGIFLAIGYRLYKRKYINLRRQL